MNTILKWILFVLGLVLIVSSIYGFVVTLNLRADDFLPEKIPILITGWIFLIIGSVFICIGSFKEKKEMIIMGVIVFIVGVAAIITSNSTILWTKFNI